MSETQERLFYCIECGQLLSAEEYFYGHDCEDTND